jgi:hypothetical protein
MWWRDLVPPLMEKLVVLLDALRPANVTAQTDQAHN